MRSVLLVGGLTIGVCLVINGLANRDWSVGLDEQRNLLITTGTAVSAIITTQAVAPASYPLLVAAAIAGWIPVGVCQLPTVSSWLCNQFETKEQARSAGWLVMAVVAIWGPYLVAAGQRPLLAARIPLALLGVVMAVANGSRSQTSDNASDEQLNL